MTPEPSTRLFCTFRLADHLCGVDVLAVKEINTQTCCTRIPQAPPAVRGYVNLRGQIHLMLDATLLLGLGRSAVCAESRLVVFKPSVGEAFGILVDEIGDIVSVADDQVEPEPPETDHPAIVTGVAKLKPDLLLLLEPRGFLTAIESMTARESR